MACAQRAPNQFRASRLAEKSVARKHRAKLSPTPRVLFYCPCVRYSREQWRYSVEVRGHGSQVAIGHAADSQQGLAGVVWPGGTATQVLERLCGISLRSDCCLCARPQKGGWVDWSCLVPSTALYGGTVYQYPSERPVSGRHQPHVPNRRWI